MFENLNNKKLLDKRAEWFNRLTKKFNGDEQFNPFYIDGIVCFPDTQKKVSIEQLVNSTSAPRLDPYVVKPQVWLEEALKIADANAARILNDDFFSPIAIEFGMYGVHFTDKMFGANVYFKDGQWNCEYLNQEVGNLKTPDENNETWVMAKNYALEYMKFGVALPVFGLPTIASALNVALNLYGDEILVQMMVEPEAAMKDLETINNWLIKMHKWYQAHLPKEILQPVVSWQRTVPFGYGQLCGCSTQLVSGELYEEMIAPLDDKLLGAYPNGGMIHICGSHAQHVNAFKNMKNLRALQLNDRACSDLDFYLKNTRPDQLFYVNFCKEMSPEEALKISNGGKRIILVGERKS